MSSVIALTETASQRIDARCYDAAEIILLLGAIPWDIDEAMVEFGFAIGPLQAQDLIGHDVGYARRKYRRENRKAGCRYVTIYDRMVEEGRIGKKGSVGWYRYPGGGGPVEDPLIEDLVAEEAWFAKVPRRPFTKDEITRRLVSAMISEAYSLLGEWSTPSADEIDRLSIDACGFPKSRGGLISHAIAIGLNSIIADLEEFLVDDPSTWAVPQALLDAAKSETCEQA